MKLCSNCKGPNSDKKKAQCEICRSKSASANRRKYEQRLAEGKCPKCGNPNDREDGWCNSCYLIQQNKKEERKQKKKLD